MRYRSLALAALLLAASGTALAASLPEGQVAVAKPEPHMAGPAPAVPPRPSVSVVFDLTGGPMFIPGRGWGGFGRLGTETRICSNADCTGPFFGVAGAWEGWGAPAYGGLSLVIGWIAGFATRHLFASAGF